MILNGRTLLEVLPLRDLYIEYSEHRRLEVFVHKGRECVICNREGVLLLLVEDKGGGLHVDLYTEDFVLMTVDHTVPKSIARQLGWSKAEIEDLDNRQTMCDPCNNKKGNKPLLNNELRQTRVINPPKHKGVEVIRQLVHNENIFNKDLKGIYERGIHREAEGYTRVLQETAGI
jgi:5-methylcytosine-specific restriction endonuclease McrA